MGGKSADVVANQSDMVVHSFSLTSVSKYCLIMYIHSEFSLTKYYNTTPVARTPKPIAANALVAHNSTVQHRYATVLSASRVARPTITP